MILTILIALSILGANPRWSDDDYRFALADAHPTETRAAIAIVQALDCRVYEDLTATCEKGAN